MKSRAIGFTLIGFGVLCLLCLSFMKWYEGYSERRAATEIAENVRNSVFLVEHEEASQSNEPLDNTVELTIEELSPVEQDQEVAEVVTYKNVLDIPKIECQAYIGEGTTAYNLSRGVGHHSETPAVGEVGNCVIAGHASLSWWCIFNRLEEMQILDTFNAYDAQGTKHTYYIIKRFVAMPNQMSILNNTDDGRSTITIYTCTEGGTKRFVIVGTEFKTEEELNEFKNTYFKSRIDHMRTVNENINVEDVDSLVGMRSTRRSYLVITEMQIPLRPWYSDESAYSDVGLFNFGIFRAMGVAANDTAQD